MKRQDLVDKIHFFHRVEFQSECNCDFDWFITPDGGLCVNTTHDICKDWFKLYVDEHLIMEKFAFGEEKYYCGFTGEDIPQAIKDTMQLPEELGMSLQIAHHVEKRDALAEFIVSHGYFPERYENFFLLVDFHTFIPISWEEALDWATKYLDAFDPYFIFVDNTKFIEQKFSSDAQDLPEDVSEGDFYDKALIRATFPLLDATLFDMWEQYRDVLHRFVLAGMNIEFRVEIAKAIKELEADLYHAHSLVDNFCR